MRHHNTTTIDRALKRREVGERLGLSDRTIRRKINSGEFPKPDFYLGREQRWRLSTIERHLAELEQCRDTDRAAVRRRCERQMNSKK